METVTTADYILYAFLGFNALLMVAIVVALWRLSRDNGEMKGEIRGINRRLDELTGRVANLEQTVLTLVGEVGEIKGRLELMLRHRHEPETGRVVLTPEEVASD